MNALTGGVHQYCHSLLKVLKINLAMDELCWSIIKEKRKISKIETNIKKIKLENIAKKIYYK